MTRIISVPDNRQDGTQHAPPSGECQSNAAAAAAETTEHRSTKRKGISNIQLYRVCVFFFVFFCPHRRSGDVFLLRAIG